jgi:hypothetical protein
VGVQSRYKAQCCELFKAPTALAHVARLPIILAVPSFRKEGSSMWAKLGLKNDLDSLGTVCYTSACAFALTYP